MADPPSADAPRPLTALLNLFDVEAAARATLPPMIFGYYASGANDEITLRENRRAFDHIALRPRVLADVTVRDLSATVLGTPLPMPMVVAPMALQRMAHSDGEIATARAAGALGIPVVLSTFATVDVETVHAACGAPVWLQLYVFRDRGVTKTLVERAERAGCMALVVTVDTPVLGRRECDMRNEFRLPEGIALAHEMPEGMQTLPHVHAGSGLAAHAGHLVDPSLSWRDLDWLRSITRLPMLLKGILRADDARRAVDHGAAGIIVSNHGGRQLDTAIATVRALPDVAEAAGDRVAILVDGGIRRGTDIIKALALGARAVCVGRPVLWGLAVAGEAGVSRVLTILRDEVDLAMALCGCRSIAEITRDLVAVGSA